MVHLRYGPPCRCVSGYYKLIVLPPRPTYLFKFVGFYPRSQYFFVLFQFLRGYCSYEQFVGEDCYVTVGTFTRRGLSHYTETLGLRVLVSSTKSKEDSESF